MARNFRYPLQAPVVGGDGPTEATDYVMFRRFRIDFNDTESNYYGLNIPNNGARRDHNKDRVYIAMPTSLQTSYNPTYKQVELGAMGLAMVKGVNDTSTEGLTKTVQEMAAAALPEFMNSAFVQAASSASSLLGLQGNLDSNSLAALTGGKVFNPYSEQLFSNMQFRNHQFQFKMFARNKAESEEIAKIIRYLKAGALPQFGGDQSRFIEVPDKFEIRFIRMDPRGRATESDDLHFKIHASVCTGIDVNYTPDGQYNAFRDTALGTGTNKPMQVPAVNVSLRFTETRFVTSSDVTNGY